MAAASREITSLPAAMSRNVIDVIALRVPDG
jgi:hypothetical protein